MTVPVPGGISLTARGPAAMGVDGLGDRDRSLSPEGWDTLLTTLTPDPQPPSASSSFVSTAASQSAVASSNTSMSEQPAATDSTQEPPCESGCENSDTEEPEAPRRPASRPEPAPRLDRPDRVDRRIMNRRHPPPVEPPFVGSVRFQVPDYSSDNHAGLLVPFAATYLRRSPSAQANRPREPEGFLLPSNAREQHIQREQQEQRDGWVGQLSVGSSDDELPREDLTPQEHIGHTRLPPRGSAPSRSAPSRNRSSGEEELMGMQRIVRSLVYREDIPDEWWAEAGLSRSLTRS